MAKNIKTIADGRGATLAWEVTHIALGSVAVWQGRTVLDDGARALHASGVGRATLRLLPCQDFSAVSASVARPRRALQPGWGECNETLPPHQN
jgi:hypothetical protein